MNTPSTFHDVLQSFCSLSGLGVDCLQPGSSSMSQAAHSPQPCQLIKHFPGRTCHCLDAQSEHPLVQSALGQPFRGLEMILPITSIENTALSLVMETSCNEGVDLLNVNVYIFRWIVFELLHFLTEVVVTRRSTSHHPNQNPRTPASMRHASLWR